MNGSKRLLSRRSLIKHAAAATALTIVPREVLGGAGRTPAPSDKLNVGCIGVGAQGTRVMMDFLKQPDVQIVAVCDVNRESSDYSEWGTGEIRNKIRQLLGSGYSDWGSEWKGATCGREPARRIVEAYYASRSPSGEFHGCTAYNDFRELLAKEKELDAVIVCTPDHWHAPISIAAMKAGKHVYCQKPMTHSILEARRMADVSRETRRATQVAVVNQASEDTRRLEEWIGSGVIGPVRRVENWSTRPFWPQGINRPEAVDPITPGLDWDLWLGPAPYRPFNHTYLPFVWRGWFDFGTGCIGDMGCYSFDTIFRVLKLGPPESVEASSTAVFRETFPAASIITFHFATRKDLPPVTLTWYDGGLKPPRPAELEDGREMGIEGEGLLFIGDHGTIMCGFNGERPQLIPESKMKAFTPPPKSLSRSPGHDREWIEATKGGSPAGASFDFEAPITETILLGNVALRTGKKLLWDSPGMKVTNDEAAQRFLRDTYREGWSI